jgi:hypothetical protein
MVEHARKREIKPIISSINADDESISSIRCINHDTVRGRIRKDEFVVEWCAPDGRRDTVDKVQ